MATLPKRTSSTRSRPLPLMTVVALPLPVMFTLSVMSRSPDALLSSPDTRSLRLTVLTAKTMLSAPALALACEMAQRSVPAMAAPSRSRSRPELTV